MNINEFKNADLAIILGSGIKFQHEEIKEEIEIPYTEIEGFPITSVAGHKGSLSCILMNNGKKVLVFRGRFHLYEGHSLETAQVIAQYIHSLKVKNILVTNAAGGIAPDLEVSDLMMIDSIQNYQIPKDDTGLLSLVQEPPLNIQSNIKDFVQSKQNTFDYKLKSGKYVAVLGPNYESDAEIDLFHKQNSAAVGMSTYPEMLYCMKHNLNAAAISVITNSWYAKEIPTHQEVLDNALKSQVKMDQLFDLLIKEYI